MLINFEEVKCVNKFSKKNLLETKRLERDEGETNIFRTLYLYSISNVKWKKFVFILPMPKSTQIYNSTVCSHKYVDHKVVKLMLLKKIGPDFKMVFKIIQSQKYPT